MQVEIKIDSSYTEPKILILTASVTEDINNLVKKLSENVPQIVSGSRDNKIEVLDPAELIRIYTNTGKFSQLRRKENTRCASDCTR